MIKFVKSLVLAISIMLMVAAAVIGCSSSPATQGDSGSRPTNGMVQSHDGGSVTIDVEWFKAENGSLIFNVAMNTHSVELDQYDLGELAVLRDDMGNEYHPVSWDSAPGGHHRKGTLTFPLPDSVSQGNAEYIEMVIRDVAGIEARVLTWEM